ncbi:hypothetical protein HAX54_043332 [Datura stramonium]|uniref:Uncharacterized protein n=1 Tax=Datura stramonium TaxID=4076 RepID=A0ABS8SNJ8_DATST|nr:hypothetical protein [Datura stramonium]
MVRKDKNPENGTLSIVLDAFSKEGNLLDAFKSFIGMLDKVGCLMPDVDQNDSSGELAARNQNSASSEDAENVLKPSGLKVVLHGSLSLDMNISTSCEVEDNKGFHQGIATLERFQFGGSIATSETCSLIQDEGYFDPTRVPQALKE